jgi:DNA-directed RNA polymerase specialized sigma24 family protein
MRRRLVTYFDRRNRPAPDLLADDVFDRISRTLEETGRIRVTPPARYCYVVARFVLFEDIRRTERTVPFDDTRRFARYSDVSNTSDDEYRERGLDCLGRCLEHLKPEDRALIIEYYRDAKRTRIERRRALAARLGITMNALSIRMWRLRANLEACVGACRKRV